MVTGKTVHNHLKIRIETRLTNPNIIDPMTSLDEFAKAFIDYIAENHSKKVALIFTYGSYARGKLTETSDLDLAYITETGEIDCLYNSFIYNGIGNEFWPISWKRLERIASAKEHYPVAAAMLAYSKILWSRSEDDLYRFNAFKTQIEEYRRPEKKPFMIKKALDIYQEVYVSIAKLAIEETLSGTRALAIKTTIDCCEALGYANQTYFSSGWGSNHQEVLDLKHRPEKLQKQMETIASSMKKQEIREAAINLAQDTRKTLIKLQEDATESSNLKENLRDYYPGIIEYVNKIKTSQRKGDKIKSTFAAYTIQNELTQMLSHGINTRFNTPSESSVNYHKQGLPDLLENPSNLNENADKLETETGKLFNKLGLTQNKVENLNEFKKIIREKCRKTDPCN